MSVYVCVCGGEGGVCLSVCLEHLGSHWMDFQEILYMTLFFRKSVEKIQVALQSDKNNGYFTLKPMYIFSLSR